MYIPLAFEENDTEVMQTFIRQFSFGTLVTVTEGIPIATHLPFLLDTGAGGCGILRGHLARANPQWRHFADAGEILII